MTSLPSQTPTTSTRVPGVAATPAAAAEPGATGAGISTPAPREASGISIGSPSLAAAAAAAAAEAAAAPRPPRRAAAPPPEGAGVAAAAAAAAPSVSLARLLLPPPAPPPPRDDLCGGGVVRLITIAPPSLRRPSGRPANRAMTRGRGGRGRGVSGRPAKSLQSVDSESNGASGGIRASVPATTKARPYLLVDPSSALPPLAFCVYERPRPTALAHTPLAALEATTTTTPGMQSPSPRPSCSPESPPCVRGVCAAI